MGRVRQFVFLAQSFCPQAVLPWPSKVPPPDMVRPSMCWNTTQPSVLKRLGSAGAFNVPWSSNSTGALQGPSRATSVSANVPPGISTLAGVVDAHASFHALSKAFEIICDENPR